MNRAAILALAAVLAASSQAQNEIAAKWVGKILKERQADLARQSKPKNKTVEWLNRAFTQRIQLSGSRALAYHHHTVDGDRSTFDSLNYYGQGDQRFTDTGSLTILGARVFNALNFQYTFTDSRFDDPENQRLSVNWKERGFTVDAGDIQGSLLNTNPYASFNRQLRGASVGYFGGRFSAKALYSESRATPRTISFNGTNSAGPYYLQNGRLVSGSESVQLDGQTQILNTDYVVDYQGGSITFVRGPIAPTSTVIVTYEAYDFNAGAGTVQGAAAGYDFGRYGRVGVTMMKQLTGSDAGSLSSRTEQFEGFGAAGTPYFLNAVPLNTAAFPTTIKVDGIRQIDGIDYVFDTGNPAIFYFRRFIPSTSIVEVVYFPKPTSVQEGDREVLGFDYRIPLAKQSYLQYNQAYGRLKNDATPLSGIARSLQGVWRNRGLSIRATLQDVPDDFVGVESRSFQRNERSARLDTEYKLGPMTYKMSHLNGRIGSRTFDNDGDLIFNRTAQRETRFGATYTKERTDWTAEVRRQESDRVGYDARLDTLSFSQSKSFGKTPWGGDLATRWETRVSLERQGGQIFDGASKNLNRTNLSYEARYLASPVWTFSAKAGLSGIRYDGQKGNGRDISVAASYRLDDKATFNASYLDSTAGSVSTLIGFEGFGLGFGGNGFSSGLNGDSLLGGADERAFRLSGTYKFNSRLSGSARYDRFQTSGSVSSNTNSQSVGLGFDWMAKGGNTLSFDLSRTDTSYLGSAFKSGATFASASLIGAPRGPWNYRVAGNALLSDGGEFAQNALYGDASLGYRINTRQSVYLRGSYGRTQGYLPQIDQSIGLFYEYRIWQNLRLVGSYKIRSLTYLDPLAAGNSGYRSRGFDLELGVSF